jgi:hypothetical protein
MVVILSGGGLKLAAGVEGSAVSLEQKTADPSTSLGSRLAPLRMTI